MADTPQQWNQFQLMARFSAWVNGRLYAAVAGLPEAEYRAERGLFFGSIHRTLNHLLVVDRLWTGRIRGEDHASLRLDDVPHDGFAALRAAREAEDARIVALVDGLDEARLRAPLRYRRIIGEGTQETRCDHALLTLYNHQTHHRGQVSAALTQCGSGHEPLDLVFFLETVGLS